MKFILKLNGLVLSPQEKRKIRLYRNKIERNFVHFAYGTPELSFVLKYHAEQQFISGALRLELRRRRIVARTGGHTITDIVHESFDKMQKEYDKYKSKYINDYGQYSDWKSIHASEIYSSQ